MKLQRTMNSPNNTDYKEQNWKTHNSLPKQCGTGIRIDIETNEVELRV